MKREISLMIVTSLIIIAQYYARVVGIVSGTNGITLVASIALRILNKWPDVSLPTCGYEQSCY